MRDSYTDCRRAHMRHAAGLLLLACLLCLAPGRARAQHEYDKWYYGNRLSIWFDASGPTAVNDGNLAAFQGCASICHPVTGELLFYTNGASVWNRRHQIMPNGQGLFGGSSSVQSSLIVPHPGDSTLYYLFTTDQTEGGEPNGYHYSLVDMTKDGGLGDVTVKNVRLLPEVSEHQTAVRHCDGRSIWVITHDIQGSSFKAFLVTRSGVLTTPVVSSLGVSFNGHGPPTGTSVQGSLKASPNGSMLAMAAGSGVAELYSFDRATGRISRPIRVLNGAEVFYHYGVTFSPDNSKLYIGNHIGLYQFALESKDPATIIASRVLMVNRSGSDLQIGPDGRVYWRLLFGRGISIVPEPNLKWPACGLNEFALNADVPNESGSFGLPNNINALHLPATCVVDADLRASATAVCPGTTVHFDARQSTHEIAWTFEGGTVVEEAGVLADVLYERPGRYRVRVVTVDVLPPDTAEAIVTVAAPPVANAGRDTTICLGACVDLTATAASDHGPIRYSWWAGDKRICDDCATLPVCPTETTIYRVVATDTVGCAGEDTVVVRVDTCLAFARIGGLRDSVCLGTTGEFDAAGSSGESVAWTFEGAEPSVSDRYTGSVLFTTPGAHRVRLIVTGKSVSDTAFMTVYVMPPPAVTVLRDTTICLGGCVSLTLSIAGGTPPFTYTWSGDEPVACPDCHAVRVCPTRTARYGVTVTDALGCVSMGSALVTVDTCRPGFAAARIAIAEDTVCLGTSIVADGSASTGSVLQWTFDGGQPGSVSAHVARVLYPAPGRYRMRLIVKDGTVADTAFAEVVVAPPPVVDAGEGAAICIGDTATLTGTITAGTPPYRLAWSPADGLDDPASPAPRAAPRVTTTYRLGVTDALGCSAIDSVTVVVLPRLRASAHVDRDYLIQLGREVSIPIVLDEPLADVAPRRIVIDLAFDHAVMRPASADAILQSVLTRGTLLDGWPVAVEHPAEGRLRIVATPPAPGTRISGTGPLVSVPFASYLSFEERIDSLFASELPFTVEVESDACVDVTTRPGRALFEVCGLSYRFMELGAAKYALGSIAPNPVAGIGTIGFTLGLDGPTRVEMLDATGRLAATLLDEHLQPGAYVLRWDAGEMASGVYYCRIVSGAWTEVRRVVVRN